MQPIDAVLAAPPAATTASNDAEGAGWTGWLDDVLEAPSNSAAVMLSLDAQAAARDTQSAGQGADEHGQNPEAEGDTLEPGDLPGDDSDAADEVLLRTELLLQAEQDLAALEAEGMQPGDVRRLVALEAERSCGLRAAVADEADDATQVCWL